MPRAVRDRRSFLATGPIVASDFVRERLERQARWENRWRRFKANGLLFVALGAATIFATIEICKLLRWLG